jgi:hypothetical protein
VERSFFQDCTAVISFIKLKSHRACGATRFW